MRRAIRTVWKVALVLLASLLIVCCYGEIRERWLVHRASELLADIHALRLNQSTWVDAQRLMSRWGAWGHYDGSCTSTDCFYVVTLHSASLGSGNLAVWPSRAKLFFSAFRLLPRQWGGGLRQLQAAFVVQDGIVRRSAVELDMTQSPFAKGAQKVCCGAELIISVVSQGSLPDSWQDEEATARHPGYTVWRPGGCTFCLMGRVAYADSISPEEAARLSDFHLSCATQWSSCLTLEQLDPAARDWHLYGPPWGEAPQEPALLALDRCPIPLYARARDATDVFEVEVASVQGRDADFSGKALVRIVSVLKGTQHFPAGTLREASSYGQTYGVREPVPLLIAQHYFVFSRSVKFERAFSFNPCEIVQEDENARKEIDKGLALDDSLRGGEVWAHLQGFHRGPRLVWDR